MYHSVLTALYIYIYFVFQTYKLYTYSKYYEVGITLTLQMRKQSLDDK